MGKDTTNTLSAENQVDQRLDGLKEDQPKNGFKADQFGGQGSTHIHRGEFGDQPSNMGIAQEMNQGGGLELRQPVGGFHGDKMFHEGEQFKSAPRMTSQLMEDPNAKMFHADKQPLQGEVWRSSDARVSKQEADQWKGETILRPHGAAAPLMEDHFKRDAELKSHSGQASRNDSTIIHDGRAPLHDLLKGGTALQDSTMRDATVYDGRTRPLVAEPNPLDSLPLADRVVAGVHAGDPLSGATLKSEAKLMKEQAKKAKKDQKLLQKKGDSPTFGADEHFKSDKDLIPHEHLKKTEPVLASEHLAGGAVLEKQERFSQDKPVFTSTLKEAEKPSSAKKNKKDKKLKKEKHLEKDVNIVESAQFHRDLDRDFTQDSHNQLSRDAHFNKDLNKADDQDDRLTADKDTHLASEKGSGKSGKLKDKVHRKKEQLKEKMHLKKDEELTAVERSKEAVSKDAHAFSKESGPKGHEIATIKIPGIESGDRAAQEMVNHQAKAKKELNAELKEHAGHSDHIAPSEISGHGMVHGMAQMNLHENRAVDTQLSMPNRGGMSDQITKDQIFAKSELNAEIKNHSGESFLPSNISGEQGSQFQRDQFNLSNPHGDFGGDRLAGLSATNDVTARDHILAKKDFNAEIKGAAGFSDHIMPSAIAHKQGEHELHGEKLAGLSGTSDALMKDNILAKKEVNAEIEHAGSGFFGKRDIMPSSVNTSMGATIKEKISDAATAMKGTFKQSEQVPDRQLLGEKLAGLSGNNDALMQDNILAKKEVNAEIEHAGAGFFGKADRVVPSAIHSSLTETIKEKANNAAAAMKDTFGQEQRPYDRQLQGEQLAGLAGTNDALVQENIFAKKEVTAEIEKAGTGFFGKSDIMPSAVAHKSSEQFPREHLPGEQLAGLSATNDALMQENIFAKKSVNAEIEKAGAGLFGKHDIMPSAINHSMGETIKEKVSNAATAVKEKWQGEQFARDRLPGEQLAGLSGTSDSLVQENILAKKEVNAEIQHAGAGLFGKHDIVPSSISQKESQFPRERLPGEQIAGLSATSDALIQDNILAKKEVNAEIEHAGSGFFGKRDIMPSSIHKQSDNLPREHVPGEQLAGMSGTSDALMQENILAKKEVNAEIQHAGAGFLGKHDIKPSSIHKESDHAPRERLPAEQLAGLSGTSDSMMKENILARKEVNAEIQHAGAGLFGKHDIMPSSISHKESQIPRDHPHGEQLAGLSGTGDVLMQDNILAKKEVNSEIEHAGTGFFGKADRVMPSAIHNSMTGTIKDKVSSAANALKDTWQGSSKQELHPQGEQLAGLSGTGDSLVQENILAKKEVNAEIEHAGTGFFGKRDQILPSDLPSKDAGLEEQHLSFAAMLKEKVTNAAIAVKETLQSYKPAEKFPHDHELHGEELAGLSGSNDALMQENILAKKEVNAEIEHAGSGFFGKHDIVPSTIHGSMTETIKEKVSNAATAVKDRWQGEQLSNDRLPGEQLAGLSGTSDILMQDNILAKKEVNAEIEHAATGFFGKTHHIVPSAIHSQDAVVNKDLRGERLAGLGSTKDDVVKEHILAKEELNAEIKEHSTNTDQILPSDISSAAPTAGITVIHDGRSEVSSGLEEHPQSIGEMIKSRVTNAATVVKETLSNLH